MVKVLFFAKLREDIGVSELDIDAETVKNSDQLLYSLERDLNFQLKGGLESRSILVAVNQDMASLPFDIVEGDEIAFFPPVTGG